MRGAAFLQRIGISMETKEKTYRIYFDKEINSVVMEWNGYATSDQFRKGTELMLEQLVHFGTTKVLANIKRMTMIGLEDQHWLEYNFLPRAFGAGFRVIAMVKPEAYFSKVAVEEVNNRIDPAKLVMAFFDTEQEARQWLKEH